jgi:hypothetical protein
LIRSVRSLGQPNLTFAPSRESRIISPSESFARTSTRRRQVNHRSDQGGPALCGQGPGTSTPSTPHVKPGHGPERPHRPTPVGWTISSSAEAPRRTPRRTAGRRTVDSGNPLRWNAHHRSRRDGRRDERSKGGGPSGRLDPSRACPLLGQKHRRDAISRAPSVSRPRATAALAICRPTHSARE